MHRIRLPDMDEKSAFVYGGIPILKTKTRRLSDRKAARFYACFNSSISRAMAQTDWNAQLP